MNIKEIKNKTKYLPRIFTAVMILSAFAAVTRVAAYQISAKSLPSKIEKAAVINNTEDEKVQKLIADSKEAANDLKRSNLFVPPAPKPQQPVCVGIFGDLAIFGNQGYKIGEQVSGAEILEIGGNEVTIQWEGNEVKLVPFAMANGSYSSGKGSRGPSKGGKPSGDDKKEGENSRPEDGRFRGGFGGGPPDGRFGFQMTDEQRQRMMEMRSRYENASPEERDRMREEFRSRMGFGGDRGGDRGGFGGRSSFGGRGSSGRGR